MEEPFDELSKALAGGLSRREAFRRAGGLLVGAMVASLGLDRPAWAAGTNCQQRCSAANGRAACLHGDCKGLSGRALNRCLANCVPLWGRDCRLVCYTCRRACTNGHHEDVACTQDCMDSCPTGCDASGYPHGQQWDHCIFVCAQCDRSKSPFCGAYPQAAHCCHAPRLNCFNGECQACPDGFKDCVESASVTNCCSPDEQCVNGKCQCPAGTTQCAPARPDQVSHCCRSNEYCEFGSCHVKLDCTADTTACPDEQHIARECCTADEHCALGSCRVCGEGTTFCGAPTFLYAFTGGDVCTSDPLPADSDVCPGCLRDLCCRWLDGFVVAILHDGASFAPPPLQCCYGPDPTDPTVLPIACANEESCCWAQFVFNGELVTEVLCCPPNDQFHTYTCQPGTGCVATPV